MAGNLAAELRLLLVTDDRFLDGDAALARCLAAVAGGVTAVQLRRKQTGDREFLALARAWRARLPVPLFLNDRADLALAVAARGVHLGSDDLAPGLARRALPRGMIIGASVGTPDEVARGLMADYWGIGPLRSTPTKPDAGTGLGVAGLLPMLHAAGSRPCVAIGGIRPGDVPVLLAAGFVGVAVSSGILGADDPGAAANAYR